jgi:anti-sigma factor RsiW
MNCSISDAQWTDYLDGSLPARKREPIEAHLRICPGCRSEVEALRQIDRRLRIECGIALQAIDLRLDAQAAQSRILAALRDAAAFKEPATGAPSAHQRLWRVRWVLALLCGSNTAARIVQAAASYAIVPASMAPSEQTWLAFLRRLAFLTTEICGCFAGDLIWAVGK